MFSETIAHFDLPTNALYREKAKLLSQGTKILDLVSGNVHEQGLNYPYSILQRVLRQASKRAHRYRPDPLGQRVAREAISRYYAEQGLSVSCDYIVLTPGTSVSYWYAFKLLANPGEEILSPQPSYPLFDSIAALCGVRMVPYRLQETQRWEIDWPHMESQITPKTRAIVLISPHNPTGAVANAKEIVELATLASRHQLPIIADEVFSPFLFCSDRFSRPAETQAPLVLTLNGFSKMFALPGLKIGWLAVSGETSLVQKALKALEMISDTFLPVNEVAQCAVPGIFSHGRDFLKNYRAEISSRCKKAVELLARSKRLPFIRPEGGFYLTVRIKDGKRDEETMALDLLKKERILIHPGYFYDLEPDAFVLSFVTKPKVLEIALQKIMRYAGASNH